MNELLLWQELVDRLVEQNDVSGEAFAEVGHGVIARLYVERCPCGCVPGTKPEQITPP